MWTHPQVQDESSVFLVLEEKDCAHTVFVACST